MIVKLFYPPVAKIAFAIYQKISYVLIQSGTSLVALNMTLIHLIKECEIIFVISIIDK